MRNANAVVIVDIVVAAAFNIAGVVAAFVFFNQTINTYLLKNQSNESKERLLIKWETIQLRINW